MSNETSGATPGHDPYAALRLRDFRRYLGGNFLAVLGGQMQTVAVGWEIYARTQSELALGLVGLVQFIPVVTLALITGHIADRFNRKWIVMVSLGTFAMSALGLAWISAAKGDPRLMYVCLFVSGVARAFQQPAKSSLMPLIVPAERFGNAVTWNTGSFHLASVLGPALAGALIAFWQEAAGIYILDAVAALGFLSLLARTRIRTVARSNGGLTFAELAGGLQFLRRTPIILGAITLDMFAVLLGGATTLLPVYAEDILDVGPRGLGLLRAAPAIGALTMSLVLAHRPPLGQAGKSLLWGVAGFGVATIVFGASRWFALSLAVLFLAGALDNISVVIRHTLVQVLTPDELRGRVSAINGLFIGASNELGGFESGLVADLFTPTISVVSGGIGTLVVVVSVAYFWPQLRRYGRLDSRA